jgi:twitching motility two-component system response regulator PilG
MESNNTFRITAFGLSERELRVLKTICLVSSSRPRAYELLNAEASRAAHFAIVNGDAPEAVAAWQLFQARNPAAPAVVLANEPVSDWQGHQIGRPIMSTRLLAILDHLEVHRARPASNRPAAAEV